MFLISNEKGPVAVIEQVGKYIEMNFYDDNNFMDLQTAQMVKKGLEEVIKKMKEENRR